MVTLYCLGNDGHRKSLHMFSTDTAVTGLTTWCTSATRSLKKNFPHPQLNPGMWNLRVWRADCTSPSSSGPWPRPQVNESPDPAEYLLWGRCWTNILNPASMRWCFAAKWGGYQAASSLVLPYGSLCYRLRMFPKPSLFCAALRFEWVPFRISIQVIAVEWDNPGASLDISLRVNSRPFSVPRHYPTKPTHPIFPPARADIPRHLVSMGFSIQQSRRPFWSLWATYQTPSSSWPALLRGPCTELEGCCGGPGTPDSGYVQGLP